jgi:hypothetical protein
MASKMVSRIILKEYYQHYKTGHLYQLESIAKLESSGEPMAVYSRQKLTNFSSRPYWKILERYTRPLKEFEEDVVDIHGNKIPRFKLVNETE